MSMLYETLLLAAVLLSASLAFLVVSPDASSTVMKPLFQLYLLGVTGGYFTWFWTHGGQTLAMKTWRLRVISSDGNKVSLSQAVIRLVFALAGLLLAGAGYFWAFLDRDRQFLHDRLAGTRIVEVNEKGLAARG